MSRADGGRLRGLQAWGGVAGPAAFTGAWLIGGAVAPGYRPVHDTISRLAASGAPTRPLMTAGFGAFGVGLVLYGRALRRAVPGRAWLAATGTGVATLGVAALPLEISPLLDRLHAAVAGVAYATLAATPLLAAAPLRAVGHRGAASGSLATGTLCAAILVASVVAPPTGALQRSGLGVGHGWIVASAIWMVLDGAGGATRSIGG